MIAQELEVTLHMAFMDARQRKHESKYTGFVVNLGARTIKSKWM